MFFGECQNRKSLFQILRCIKYKLAFVNGDVAHIYPDGNGKFSKIKI